MAVPDWEINEANGAWITTTDGRSLIDLSNTKGSILLGHRDPDVVAGVRALLESGLSGWRVEALVRTVGEKILARVPDYDSVAYFKTGTAAVRAVATAARRVTGKPLLVSAGYHGWDPMWLPPRTPFTVNDHGVFDCFYVPDELEAFLERDAGRTAAAILAPDLVNLPASTLERLFTLCREHGVPVVADEVKLGLRLEPGLSIHGLSLGAEAAVLSKGLANGLPFACVAGCGDLISAVIGCHSTLTYEGLAFAACDATLDKLARVDAPGSLAREGGRFLAGAAEIFDGSGLPIRTQGPGAIFQFVFGGPRVEESFHRACAEAGLRLYEGDNQTPSWAFRDDVVDEALERLAAATSRVAGELPDRVGTGISSEAWWTSAWNQMDGFCDPDADPDARRAFLAEQLAAEYADE